MDVEDFIREWSRPPRSERGAAQSFVIQLCRMIGVAAPNDERVGDTDYCFEHTVRFQHEDGTTHWGFIDCYRKGSFVLEVKQTQKRLSSQADIGRMRTAPSNKVERLLAQAKMQAQGYASALADPPPFLIIVDLSGWIELWADFSRSGAGYLHFPNRESFRIAFSDLRDPKVRQRLAAVWTDPKSLDPASKAAVATTEIAVLLGRLVRTLRAKAARGADGTVDPVHRAAWDERVAIFIMQCLFAMFADSVGLIENRAFSRCLKENRGNARNLHRVLRQVFRDMNTGGYSHDMRCKVRWFNGGLYAKDAVIALTEGELDVLCEAAERDWSLVDPAIFGSLMETALSSDERSRLGAHFTPKATVEIVVQTTVIDVLRKEWEAVAVTAGNLSQAGKTSKAQDLVKAFHDQLCHIKVLDPACGTGNFLYVAMDMMKDLEAEVLEKLIDLGVPQGRLQTDGQAVGPGQFLGIDKNPQVVWIMKLVMWIGHLQWQYRLWGRANPSDPVLKDYGVVEEMDAALGWRRQEPAPGTPDGVRYVDVHAPTWPKAHFIVGNPPFIAGKDIRRELGDAYAEGLWTLRGGRFRSADLVTVWWDRAAEILAQDADKPGPFDAFQTWDIKNDSLDRKAVKAAWTNPALQRFGFVTTNSITQALSRRVVEARLSATPPIRLTFAVPDHPWVKKEGAAAVRIAMTVAEAGAPDGKGRLLQVTDERPHIAYATAIGDIGADLTIGRGIERTSALKANAGLAHRGVQLMGEGFLISSVQADVLAALSRDGQAPPVRPYRNGKDLTERSRDLQAIDLFGWTQDDACRQHPGFMQHLRERVKPERDRNARAAYRDNWWIFGEPRRDLRVALAGLSRFIVTVETSKHRWFRFLDASILPDNRLVCVASDDPFILGVLSSSVHRAWAAAVGGRLEDRPVYSKGVCFDRFPFPDASSLMRFEIATAAERMDEHRAHVLARNPAMGMTTLYNVLAKVAVGAALSEEEQAVRHQGCVDVLLDYVRRIDQLVLQAYGWPTDLDDDAIVARLTELNQARADEEREGHVRFLRPDYQAARLKRGPAAISREIVETARVRPQYSSRAIGRAIAVLDVLTAGGRPMTVRDVRAALDVPKGSRKVDDHLKETLDILTAAGSIYETDVGWFAPRRVAR